MKETRLCTETDCFNKVDVSDFVIMKNGETHPESTKCWDCRNRKTLKNYLKKQRYKANKAPRPDALLKP